MVLADADLAGGTATGRRTELPLRQSLRALVRTVSPFDIVWVADVLQDQSRSEERATTYFVTMHEM
jgi:hypothetical protein